MVLTAVVAYPFSRVFKSLENMGGVRKDRKSEQRRLPGTRIGVQMFKNKDQPSV